LLEGVKLDQVGTSIEWTLTRYPPDRVKDGDDGFGFKMHLSVLDHCICRDSNLADGGRAGGRSIRHHGNASKMLAYGKARNTVPGKSLGLFSPEGLWIKMDAQHLN
jgi:hypothetical protein